MEWENIQSCLSDNVQNDDRFIPREGQGIKWENINGDKFHGIVTEMDSNVAYVIDQYGKKHVIEC